jgi:hypothetical protein
MDKFIKDRLSTIIALVVGTGSGWGFTEIITAPELKTWLITISIAVSFLLSLIISLSLMGRIPVERRKKIIRKTIAVFSAFILCIILFFIFYSKYTITIPLVNIKGEISDTNIVKGLFYTPGAKNYRDAERNNSENKLYPTDDSLLDNFTYDIQKVWSDSSRTYARLLLLFLYTLMIGFFIAGVTLTTEVITHNKKDLSG